MEGITREEKTGPEKGIERLGQEMEKERRLPTETEMRGPGKAMAPGLEMKGMNTVKARYQEMEKERRLHTEIEMRGP